MMFAIREVPYELLGFSPNLLVLGHQVHDLLDLVRERWSGSGRSKAKPLRDFFTLIHSWLLMALELARDILSVAWSRMKVHCDKKAKVRTFKPVEEVLALLPLQEKPLAAKFSFPYLVKKMVGDLDYLIALPDKCKDVQLCHINML